MARPTVLTPELAATICERLAEVGSLRRVCADREMPTDVRVRQWVAENPEFADAYARAKAIGIDALVEEGMDLVDEQPPSSPLTGAIDTGHVSWAKNRAEYRRWLAERMAPKKYGVKSALDLSNTDGTLAPTDATQRAARAAALLKVAEARKALDDISDIV